MEAAADPARSPRAFPLSGRRRQRAAGERIASFFEEHGRMVYGVCRLILRDPVEAEDAAQQTFLSAYRALLGGKEPRDPSAWLGTIARNECRSRLRRRTTEPLRLVREPVGDELQRDVGRREEIQALCAALAELPPQQRDVIVLREFYGLSYAEVGAALGLTGPAVESLIFRSRKRLQEQLRPVRSALGLLTLPVTLQESLAQALPGFGGGGASAGGAAVIAKVASAPLAAKIAAVTLAVGGAGTVASLETAHVVRHRAAVRHAAAAAALAPPAALAAPAPRATPIAFAASRPVESRSRPAPAPPKTAPPARQSVEAEHSSGDGGQERRSGTTEERRSGGGDTSRAEPRHQSEPQHEQSSGGEDPSHVSEPTEPSHEDGSGGGEPGQASPPPTGD